MNRQYIITVSNLDTMEYFFTTDHCQKHGLGDKWVPCTYRLPMQVTPRESLPFGLVTNKEELKTIFYNKLPITDQDIFYKEIPNPQSEYQA